MKYVINKYIAYELGNGHLVVQNQDSIVSITNEIMKELILSWERQRRKYVDTVELERFFGHDVAEAIEFLGNYNIIREEKEKVIHINQITVATNQHDVGQLIANALREDYGDRLYIQYYDVTELPDVLDANMLVVFFNPYNKNLGKSMKLKQDKCNQSVMLLSYVYRNNFYMDCLYSPDWKVPCHECHIGHIEAQAYVDEESGLTYQRIIDTLYSIDSEFPVHLPLTGVQKLNIARLIVNKVFRYLNDLQTSKIHPEEFTNCCMLDLRTLKTFEDTSIHWEMCSCYEI